jgi:hypothetical protein
MEIELYSTSGMARFAGCSEASVRRAARAGIIKAQLNSSGARQFSHREAEKLREHVRQRRSAAA